MGTSGTRNRGGLGSILKRVAGAIAFGLGCLTLYPIWAILRFAFRGRHRGPVSAEGFEKPYVEDADPEEALAAEVRERRWARNLIKVFAFTLLFSILPPFGISTVMAAHTFGPPDEVTLTPTGVSNEAGTPHTVTATVSDVTGSAVEGAVVTFTAAGTGVEDPAGPITGTTNHDGLATFTFTSTRTGSSVVTATIDDTATTSTATATKEWTPAELDHFLVEAVTPQFVGDCFVVSVTAQDVHGNTTTNTTGGPLTTATVSSDSDDGVSDLLFHAGDGTCAAAGTATEDLDMSGDGFATTTARDTDAEIVTITADQTAPAGAATGNTQVEIVPTSTMTVTPTSDTNEVNTPHTVTATVTNTQTGSPVAGVTVTITAEGPPGGLVPPTQTVTQTNADGQVTFTFTSTMTGTSLITATSVVAGTTHVVTATKNWGSGVGTTVTVTPTAATNTVGEVHTVTAHVVDEFGNDVSGTVVTFTAGGTGGEDPTFATATTDENGIATFTFTSTRTGDSQIVASVPGSSPLTNAGFETGDTTGWSTGNSVVVASSHTGDTDSYDPVIGSFFLVLEDGDENVDAFASQTVALAAGEEIGGFAAFDSHDPDGGSFDDDASVQIFKDGVLVATPWFEHVNGIGTDTSGPWTPWSFTADTSGDYTIVYRTANRGDGTENSHALFDGPKSTSATATKTWIAGDATTVTVTPSGVTNTVGETHTVTATVEDGFGNRVPNSTVTFTAAGTGFEDPSEEVTFTDNNGVATFTFTSTKTGTSTVTATAPSGAFGTATKGWDPDDPADVILRPEFATNTVGDPHTVTAEVVDRFGNRSDTGPRDVVFSATGTGAEDPSVLVTETSGGVATYTFTSTRTGTSTILVLVDDQEGGFFEDTATKTWLAGAAFSVTLTPKEATNTVDTTHTVTALVTDEFGNRVEDGTEVDFCIGGCPPYQAGDSTGAENPPGGGATTTNGVATFSFTSNQAGRSDIVAVADPTGEGGIVFFFSCFVFVNGELCPHDFATKTWVAATPTTVTVSPDFATNTVGDIHTVTAHAVDEFDNDVSGTVVTFTAGGTGGEDPTFATATTDENGVATFTFTSTRTGTSTVTGTISNGAFDTATKVWEPDEADDVILEPEQAKNLIGTTHTVTATIVDRFGNRVDTDHDTVFTATGTGDEHPSAKFTVAEEGLATYSFSSDITGTSNILVEVDLDGVGTGGGNLAQDRATKVWHDVPATITVTPESATNTVGDPHTVTATVSDEDGVGIPGEQVTFTAAGTGGEDPVSSTATTDFDGNATFTFTSNQAGRTTITVVDEDGRTATATKDWLRGPAQTITVTPTAATNTVGTTHTFTVTATDRFGNPADDDTVTMTVTGPGETETTQTTDAEGVATFTFSSTQAGTSLVTFTIGTATATATKTWVHASATTVTVTPKDATNTVGTVHTITARAVDRFENPVGPGETATMTVSGVGATETTQTTDADGRVTFTFSSTQAGTSLITVTVGTATGTATKTWVTSAAHDVVLEPQEATNTVGDPHTVTATVVDEFGNRVHEPFIFHFEAAGTGSEDPDEDDVFGPDGEATFTFTATQVGTSIVTVAVDTSGGTLFATATKHWVHGPGAQATITPTSATNTVGENHTVTVKVFDRFGNEVGAGEPVTFTVGGTGGEDPVSATATTDSDGRATFTFTSTRTGRTIITVTMEDGASTASKDWVAGPPDFGLADQDDDTNEIGENHTVSAAFVDEFGNAVADGTVVTFTVTGEGARVVTRTTTGGVAFFTFTSNHTGVSFIEAAAQGETQTVVTNELRKEWVCGAPGLSPSFFPYDRGFGGGIFVAGGDVNGDGCDDVIFGADQGGGPHVKVYNGRTGGLIASFFPYAIGFTGGVRVGSGDVNGDGFDDVITGAGPGGGPHVRALSGKHLTAGSVVPIHSFFAYAPGFTGGVYVAGGDINNSGPDDIITGAGQGGGPHVRVFRGSDLALMHSFFAYAPGFTGGVRVGSGDVNGGADDVITGAGPGGGPHVKVFSAGSTLFSSFFAYGPGFTGGVFVAGGDVNGSGPDDVITGAGEGGGPHVRAFSAGNGGALIRNFFAYGVGFTGGVRVGAADLAGDGNLEILTGAGPGGGPHAKWFN